MSEKEHEKKELSDAWKRKETEVVAKLLMGNPRLYEQFDLVEIGPRVQFSEKSKVFLLSVLISSIVGLAWVANFHLARPLMSFLVGLTDPESLLVLVLGGLALLIASLIPFLLSVTVSCLISLEPLNFKSLKLPIYVLGLSAFFGVIMNALIFSVNEPFDMIFALSSLAGLASSVVLGFPARFLTKKVIGLPRCDEPVKKSLKVDSNINNLLEALSGVLKLHLFSLVEPKELSEIPSKGLAKFGALLNINGVTRNFTLAMEIVELTDTNESILKAFLYQEEKEAVISDEFCRELMEEIVGDIEMRLKIEPWPRVGYSELFDYSLGYTESKIQPFLDSFKTWITKIPKYVFFIIFFGAVSLYPVIANWNLVMQWRETIYVIAGLATIITLILLIAKGSLRRRED